MGPAVKGGWLAASVVTRGVVAGVRYSYTRACCWGVKRVVERYILGIRAGRTSISSSIAFESTVSGGEATVSMSRVARKVSRRWKRSTLSVNGEAPASVSLVTIAVQYQAVRQQPRREWHVKRLGAGNVVSLQSTERRLPAAR